MTLCLLMVFSLRACLSYFGGRIVGLVPGQLECRIGTHWTELGRLYFGLLYHNLAVL